MRSLWYALILQNIPHYGFGLQAYEVVNLFDVVLTGQAARCRFNFSSFSFLRQQFLT